jgi:hypothetical protein
LSHDVAELLPRHGDLGHAEDYRTAVPHELGADLIRHPPNVAGNNRISGSGTFHRARYRDSGPEMRPKPDVTSLD